MLKREKDELGQSTDVQNLKNDLIYDRPAEMTSYPKTQKDITAN